MKSVREFPCISALTGFLAQESRAKSELSIYLYGEESKDVFRPRCSYFSFFPGSLIQKPILGISGKKGLCIAFSIHSAGPGGPVVH